VVDTSVLVKSNMDRREYLLFVKSVYFICFANASAGRRFRGDTVIWFLLIEIWGRTLFIKVKINFRQVLDNGFP
jgi:hypothetical protein